MPKWGNQEQPEHPFVQQLAASARPVVTPPVQRPAQRRGFAAMYKSPSVKAALESFDHMKLSLPELPVDDQGVALMPKLPHDITRLSNDSLARLYGQFAAVAAYADAQLGLSDIEHADADYEFELSEANVGLQTEGSSRDKREWQTLLSQSVRDKKAQALQRRARKVLLTALLKGFDKAIAALSREQTRRQDEANRKT